MKMIERYDTTRRKRIKDRRPRWIVLGLLAIGIRTFLANEPYLTEEIYSEGIFKYIRFGFDKVTGFFGFPLVYLVLPWMVFRIFGTYIRSIRPGKGCLGRIFNFIYTTIAIALWLVFWFLLLWGFNYCRIPIEEKLDFKTEAFTDLDLREQLEDRLTSLYPLRKSLQPDDAPFTDADMPKDIENMVRKEVNALFSVLGYDFRGDMRGRMLKPKGILLRFSTSGVYFPFTGECNIDAGLHPLQKPFTLAHEMAHGMGITDEGDCNFLAYLACVRSDDPFIRYSGEFIFWRYLATGYMRSTEDKEAYPAFRASLRPSFVGDLNAINENNDKYPDFFPKARNNTYDAFLKAQGVTAGINSYGEVVAKVLSWENQKD